MRVSNFCAKCSVLGVFWALGPSRLTPWHEEESFSQKFAKITKTILDGKPTRGATFS